MLTGLVHVELLKLRTECVAKRCYFYCVYIQFYSLSLIACINECIMIHSTPCTCSNVIVDCVEFSTIVKTVSHLALCVEVL